MNPETDLKPSNYGLHLLVDAAGADPHKLADPAVVRSTLLKIVELIGLQCLDQPRLYPVERPQIVGISGILPIVTSHLAIHTYAGRGWLAADVFSCSQFEVEPVMACLVEAFGIEDPARNIQFQAIQRGHNFPPENLFPITLKPDEGETP